MSEENTLNPNEVKKVAKNEEEIRRDERQRVLELIEDRKEELMYKRDDLDNVKEILFSMLINEVSLIEQKLKECEDEAREDV